MINLKGLYKRLQRVECVKEENVASEEERRFREEASNLSDEELRRAIEEPLIGFMPELDGLSYEELHILWLREIGEPY